eukprot:Hpha_TRINITY_DN24820_c0_g1::TRINITY_DN24820_c0_g1_i1::g.97242::m.97242
MDDGEPPGKRLRGDGLPDFGLPGCLPWTEVARAPVPTTRPRPPSPEPDSDFSGGVEKEERPPLLPSAPIYGAGESAVDAAGVVAVPEVSLESLQERKGRRCVGFRGKSGEAVVFRPTSTGDALEFFIEGKRRRPFKKLRWAPDQGRKGGQLDMPDAGYKFSLPREVLPDVLGRLRALARATGIEVDIPATVTVPIADRVDDRA